MAIRARRVVGVVTVADFMRAADLDEHAGFATKLREFLKPSPGVTSDKAEVVGQIMTRRVQVVSATRSLGSMVPVFSSTGHHHIPVVDDAPADRHPDPDRRGAGAGPPRLKPR